MLFTLSVPTTNNNHVHISLKTGEMLFVLGANGTGKSSLMQALASAYQGKARRITAHRQTWFRSGSPEVTSSVRAQHEHNVKNYDQEAQSRWMDDYAQQRAQMAIYDLVSCENGRARTIARAVDQNVSAEQAKQAAGDSVFSVMNRLLRLANLDITIAIEANDEIMATRKGSIPYSIAKLSDGERNAILIAANVLTVPAGTILLIDETERHLHRSITSPLLSLLLKERPDCAFVVSTHEPLLPIDSPKSKVLLTRSCNYEGDRVSEYDLDVLEGTDAIDDRLKRTILGERRKIVFVEGEEHSLDKPLYSLLFPNASIVAVANCREVENAVVGIIGTAELHWVKPFGLVDNDSSEPDRIADLQLKGIIPLNVYSVESVYYHPDVQKLAAQKLSTVIGGNLDDKIKQAKDAALKAVCQNASHLITKIAEKAARVQVFSLLPKKGEIITADKRCVEIDYQKIAAEESARFEALITSSDFIGVLKRYPIRESQALDAIAKALNFVNRNQYEIAVRKLLIDNSDMVNIVRSIIGFLPADLIAEGNGSAVL